MMERTSRKVTTWKTKQEMCWQG